MNGRRLIFSHCIIITYRKIFLKVNENALTEFQYPFWNNFLEGIFYLHQIFIKTLTVIISQKDTTPSNLS